MNEEQQLVEGWSRRLDEKTTAWHFFRLGTTLCPRAWRDPLKPFRVRIPGGIACPECVRRRLEELQS